MSTTDDKAYKVFKKYVSLYNAINETSLTTKNALNNDQYVEFFEKAYLFINETSNRLPPEMSTKKRSTKVQSYNKINIPQIDSEVLSYIVNCDQCSRYDISVKSGIRLSTVCGAVKRLLNNNMIEVIGTKFDPESKRNVEVLRENNNV